MREIKFKAKRTDNNVWVYGYFFIDLENKLPYIMLKERNETVEDWMLKSVVVIPETVGQFTGLKDINGIDLYHGDKLQVKWGNYIWEYVISELKNGSSNTLYAMQTRQNFYVDENEEEIFEWVESTSFKNIEFLDKFKIIGNIYEK